MTGFIPGKAGHGLRPAISGSQGVQAGDHNVQLNVNIDNGRPEGPVVAGNVPLEPASFQPRTGLMEALEYQPADPGNRRRALFAVTGIRGDRQDAGGGGVRPAAD